MSGFQAHIAQIGRAAATSKQEVDTGPHTVTVPLSEAAASLPSHIIAATDPVKLNKQAPLFRCPAWAGLPSRSFHLRCTRDQLQLPALAIERFPYYLFGKHPICDYVLEHPSVSSMHAALIFNKEHACFVLLDLGSTNGTRLQGKRVEPRKPIPIAVGSVLQFGYSTRAYELSLGSAPSLKRAREEAEEGAITKGVRASAFTHSTSAPIVIEKETTASPPLPPASNTSPSFSSSAPAASLATAPPGATPLPTTHHTQMPRTDTTEDAKSVEISAPEETPVAAQYPIHLFQLVIKHKDVDNPISRGQNKGEVITRSKMDALELVRYIVSDHEGQVPVDAELGFSPWTVEEFVAAVKAYCEVSGKKKMGDLGMVEKGIFSEIIDDAAFRLHRGEVSAPVDTQLGIHLLFRCD